MQGDLDLRFLILSKASAQDRTDYCLYTGTMHLRQVLAKRRM